MSRTLTLLWKMHFHKARQNLGSTVQHLDLKIALPWCRTQLFKNTRHDNTVVSILGDRNILYAFARQTGQYVGIQRPGAWTQRLAVAVGSGSDSRGNATAYVLPLFLLVFASSRQPGMCIQLLTQKSRCSFRRSQ